MVAITTLLGVGAGVIITSKLIQEIPAGLSTGTKVEETSEAIDTIVQMEREVIPTGSPVPAPTPRPEEIQVIVNESGAIISLLDDTAINLELADGLNVVDVDVSTITQITKEFTLPTDPTFYTTDQYGNRYYDYNTLSSFAEQETGIIGARAISFNRKTFFAEVPIR